MARYGVEKSNKCSIEVENAEAAVTDRTHIQGATHWENVLV